MLDTACPATKHNILANTMSAPFCFSFVFREVEKEHDLQFDCLKNRESVFFSVITLV